MAQTIDVPPPQPKPLLQTAVITHPEPPKYHLSWAEEAAIAKKEIRATCRVTPRDVEPLHGQANRKVRISLDLKAHLQSTLRLQQLRQYDIECIGVLDDATGAVKLLKSVSTGRDSIEQNAPPQMDRIPALQQSRSTDRLERAMSTFPRINMSVGNFRDDDGQLYALSVEHTKITCKVQFSTRPAAPGVPQRPPISFSSGRVDGDEIDTEKVVERLWNYSLAIYTYAKAQMGNSAEISFSFDAELDCTKITGQERWVLQRWVKPMTIEINSQRLEAERAEAQQAQIQLAARQQVALRQAAARRGQSQSVAENQRRPPLAPAAAGVQQHRTTPAQGSLAQRRANQQRQRLAQAANQGVIRPQATAPPASTPSAPVTLRIRFEIGRKADGGFVLRSAAQGISGLTINKALITQISEAMRAARTSVTFANCVCQRNADDKYEALRLATNSTR